MSVQTQTSKISYSGNSSTVTPYPVNFPFFSNGDLTVIVTNSAGVETTLTITTDYTVSGAGNASGGNVTTLAAYDSTNTVTIFREVDATQLTSYAENDKFPSASHERALDKLTFLCQQALRKLASCLSVTEPSQNPAAGVPSPLTFATLDSSGNIAFLNPSDAQSLLNLPAPILNLPLATWANPSERAAKVPYFVGQLGLQRDTGAVYYSTALTAGSWTVFKPANATAADSATAATTATKLLTARNIALTGPVTGTVSFDGSANVSIATTVPNGSVLQSVSGVYTANADLAGTIPFDDTIPQISEGTQVISVAITPASTTSKIRVRFNGLIGTTGGPGTVALFNGATNAIAASCALTSNNAWCSPLSMIYESAAVGSLTPITFTLRVGSASGVVRLNGPYTSRIYGGVAASIMIVEEIKA